MFVGREPTQKQLKRHRDSQPDSSEIGVYFLQRGQPVAHPTRLLPPLRMRRHVLRGSPRPLRDPIRTAITAPCLCCRPTAPMAFQLNQSMVLNTHAAECAVLFRPTVIPRATSVRGRPTLTPPSDMRQCAGKRSRCGAQVSTGRAPPACAAIVPARCRRNGRCGWPCPG